MKYNFKKIEPKWQAKWEESKVFEAKDNSDKTEVLWPGRVFHIQAVQVCMSDTSKHTQALRLFPENVVWKDIMCFFRSDLMHSVFLPRTMQ